MERSSAAAHRPVGRKRDPRIEALALVAAIEVYALDGWHGFTFEAVARVSGVGKPAIYRRWSTREALLIAAFDRTNIPTARDLGGLEADVHDYVSQWVRWYVTPFLAQAANRLLVDCVSNAELDRLYQKVIFTPLGKSARQVTNRAVAREELPPGTPPTILPDLILGGMLMHWMFAPYRDDRHAAELFRADCERLVDVILRGLRATPQGGEG
ncbi:TetR/AcrR family transcriptional regulator [Nocardia bovistercoris]|uniref:TetR/AcrR family transcriptional regulator n=1 Tax=Nocardia bovistercoris TaxID=2785916 RepID=A0A931I8N2_9NOCA|nr:TetR/AcrR family transcriptional regulator [Nocardia bovistercoris]MBH0776694.1 TetR/AcrR family transcriptional regulator [Nocardia bovistercoris]